MSKFKGKLARRIMAIVLSGAMVMSNMSAYAAELAPEKETEVVSESEESIASEKDNADTNEPGNTGGTNDGDTTGGTGSGDNTGGTGDGDNTPSNPDDAKKPSLGEVSGLKADKDTADESKLVFTWQPAELTNVEDADKGNYKITYSISIKNDGSEIATGSNLETAEFKTDKITTAGTYTVSITATATKDSEIPLTSTAELTYNHEESTNPETPVKVDKPTELNVTHTIADDGKVSAEFSWKAVALTDYDITYDVEIVNKKDNSKNATKEGLTTTKVEIGTTGGIAFDLEVGQTYTFKVTAKAAKTGESTSGSSDASTTDYEITAETKLDAPAESSLEFEEKTTTDDDKKPYVIFKWGAVTLDGYNISYDIKVTEGTGDNVTEKFADNTAETSIEVGNTADFTIEADTEYTFTVTAKATTGEGASAETLEADPVSKTYTYTAATEPGKTKKYTFNASELLKDGAYKDNEGNAYTETPNKDHVIADTVLDADKTLGTDAYFKLTAKEVTNPGEASGEADATKKQAGTVKLRQNSNKYYYLELTKWASSGIQFTVADQTVATVTVNACSTGGSNLSNIGLMDSDGYILTEKDKKVNILGTTGQNVVYENIPAGTYTLVAPYTSDITGLANNPNTRGARILSISVDQVAQDADRASFGSVDAPTITEAGINADDKSKIDVTASGKVGYDGGDKLILVTKNEEGKEVADRQVSSITGDEHNFTVTPSSDTVGKVVLTVILVRGNTEKTSEAKEVEFTAPLPSPEGSSLEITEIKDADTDEITSFEFSWGAVERADAYNVVVAEKDAAADADPIFKADKIEEPKVTVVPAEGKKFEPGKTYVFSVVSVRLAEGEVVETSETPASKEHAIPKVVVPPTPGVGIQTYVFDAAKELGADGLNLDKKGTIKAGTTFNNGYFTVVGDDKAMRANSGTYSLELGKLSSNGLEFKVGGTASVTIEISSNGDTSHMAIGLRDAANKIIPNNEGIKFVTTTKVQKVTYKNLSAGTYRIESPDIDDADAAKRGVRIYTVTVEEMPAGKEINIDLSGKGIFNSAKEEIALEAAVTYGDPEIATLNVLEDFIVKDGGESCGIKYDHAVAGKGNPDPKNGAIPTKGAVYKITATKDTTATFIVKATAGKSWHVVRESDGKEIQKGAAIPEKVEFKAKAGETYYFYGDGTKIMTYAIKLSEYIFIPRGDWADVAAPQITAHKLEKKDGANVITLTVTGDVSRDGGDALTVEMYDADADDPEAVVLSKTAAAAGEISFAPSATSRYYFKAFLSRNPEEPEDDEEGEEIVFDDKESALYPATDPIDFAFALQPPLISAVTNHGNGTIEVDWGKASEAAGYEVLVTDANGNPAGSELKTEQIVDADGNVIKEAETIGEVSGLTVGETYKVQVRATRMLNGAPDYSDYSDAVEKTITQESQMKWSFSASGSSTSLGDAKPADKRAGYGANTAQPKNGFHKPDTDGNDEKDNDFEVEVWSIAGAGKVVPATTDGLAFYYTELNPNDEKNPNFEFTARAHVESWKYSNGQDGFGLMVSDTVGENGNGDYVWTNCYQNVVSKVEFKWDGTKPADDGATRYSMRLGVGATEKIGATAQDITDIWSGKLSAPAIWSSTQHPLDFSMTHLPAGTYNIVGNCENTPTDSIIVKELERVDFDLRIVKNNNGYELSYTNVATGETTTKQFFGTDVLNQIEKDKIYVGVFAGRNADVTFKNVHLEQHSADWGPEKAEQETSYINLVPTISSATTSNTSEYDFVFSSNWDGKLEIRDKDMNVVGKADVTGSLDTVKSQLEDGDNDKDTKAHVTLSGLQIGSNVFTVTFTPNKKMVNQPAYTELSSYEAVTLTHTVDYRKYGDEKSILYVSQEGKSSGTGTKADPLDIYTAIKYVQPGQKIFLAGGRYVLNKTLTIPRGTNGEEGKMIYLMADPEATQRPVFDFNGAVTGVVISGNYWYFKGFDVTGSLDGQKGIQLSGSHNTLDQINAYKNGNTGIQVSGSGNDTYNYWPQYNTILNCTSYLNADHGYEDADGFAAKLTIGSGNVFDGCIAAYNADDGWDLFAKIESGQIGSVTIRNSVAYKNGYVLKNSKGKLDLAGDEIDAGNGNGFKMGGDGLPGGSKYDTVDGKEGSAGYYDTYGKYKGHILENSVAFENKSKGFDSNSCPNNKIYNSVSFNNRGGNVELYTYNNIQETDYEVKDVISFRTRYTSVIDSVKAKGAQITDKSKYINESTYLWNKRPNASINSNNVRVDKTWFEKVVFEGTYNDPKSSEKDTYHRLLGRNSDGSINMGGFLKVIKENVGTGLEPVVSPTDEELKGDSVETEGNVSAGSGTITDEDTSGELYEEGEEAKLHRGIWIPEPTEEELALYYTYTGQPVKPEVRVYLNGKRFTDYSVSYKNNTNAYVAGDDNYSTVEDNKRPQMVLKMKGAYQGDYIKYFDILPVDVADSSKVAAPSIAVDKAQVAKVVLSFNGKNLALGKDFNVYRENVTTDENNVEKKELELINKTPLSEDTILKVVGIGNYTGTVEVPFRMITPEDNLKLMSKAKVKLDKNSYVYTGKEIRPVITLDGYDKQLAPNEEGKYVDDLYTVSIVGGTEVGKGSVIVTAKTIAPPATVEEGATPEPTPVAVYAGSKTVPFTITKAPIKIDNVTFVTREKDAEGNYKELKGKNIVFDPVSYTGSARAQAGEFKVVLEDGTVLNGISKGSRNINDPGENGTLYKYDYTYEYKNNTEAGNASIIIKGIHNCTGSVSFKFKIDPVVVNQSDIKWYRKAYTDIVDGKEVLVKPDKMTGQGLEIVYDYDMAYVSSGAKPTISIYYNGNGVSKKNYSISYKDNKNPTDKAQVIISWGGGLKGTQKTPLDYRIGKCEFEGNIYTKSVLDVFTNGKDSIKASEFDKSKAVIMNGKTRLSVNRDYTLEFRYPEYDMNLKPVGQTVTENGKEKFVQNELIYDAAIKDKAAKDKLVYVPTTGMNVEVWAKPVENGSYKCDKGAYKVADIRVAYYDIAKANIQLLEWNSATKKYVKPILYFKDVTEDTSKNVEDTTKAAMNRLDKNLVKVYHSAYAKDYNKQKDEYLDYVSYDTRSGDGFTFKESSTDTLNAGTQKVTIYGTGLFGGNKVLKYKLEKKTYNITKAVVDTKTKFYFASDEYLKLRSTTFTDETMAEKRALEKTVKEQFNQQISKQLEGRITAVNGVALLPAYYQCSYGKDFDSCNLGKAITITIKGVDAYSGIKTVKIPTQLISSNVSNAAVSGVSVEAPKAVIDTGIVFGTEEDPLNKAVDGKITVDGYALVYGVDYEVNDAEYIAFEKDENGNYIEDPNGEQMTDENGEVIKDDAGNPKKFKVARRYTGYMGNNAVTVDPATAYVCLKGIGSFKGVIEVPFTIAEQAAEVAAN